MLFDVLCADCIVGLEAIVAGVFAVLNVRRIDLDTIFGKPATAIFVLIME